MPGSARWPRRSTRHCGTPSRALLTLDRDLAYATVLGDKPINREIRELDRLCHAFVARHLPSAGHLRFVSSVLRLTWRWSGSATTPSRSGETRFS